MATITSQFSTPNVSDTKLIIALTASISAGTPEFKYVLDVEDSNGLIARLKTKPNPAGAGIFDVSGVIQDDLEFDNSKITTTGSDIGNASVKRYTLTPGDEYGNPPVIYPGSSVDKIVFKGTTLPLENNSFNFPSDKFGIASYVSSSVSSSFDDIRGPALTNKPFNRIYSKLPLTDATGSGTMVSYVDSDTLSVLNNHDGLEFIDAKIIISYVPEFSGTASFETLTIPFADSSSDLLTIPSGPKNLIEASSELSASLSAPFAGYVINLAFKDSTDVYNSAYVYVNETNCSDDDGRVELTLFGFGETGYTLNAWALIAAPPVGFADNAGFGTQDDFAEVGGFNSARGLSTGTTTTYEWDSAAWSRGGDLPYGRGAYAGDATGTRTAGLYIPGVINDPNFGDLTTATAEYNGSTWSSGGNRTYVENLTTGQSTLSGTQTAGLAVGGRPSYSTITKTEEYNGSTWSSGGDLGVVKHGQLQFGTQNAAVVASGFGYPTVQRTATYEYNGTSWSSGGNVIFMQIGRGSGTQNAGSGFGSDLTQFYDGASWSSGPNMIFNRQEFAGGGQTNNDMFASNAVPSGASPSAEIYNSAYLGPVTSGSLFSFPDLNGKWKRNKTRFAFINQYGVWDYYSIYNPYNKTTDLTHNNTSISAVDYSSDTSTKNITSRNKKTLNTFTDSTFTISTDWLYQQEADWLTEMMESPSVFLIDALDHFPIVIVNTNYTWKTNDRGQKVFKYDFVFRFANEEALKELPQTPLPPIGPVPTPPPTPLPPTPPDLPINPQVWTVVNSLNTARSNLSGAGTAQAGLAAGGQALFPTGTTNLTEEWNGTSWTNSSNLGTIRKDASMFGIQNSAVIAGGDNPSNPIGLFATEEYNGSTWSSATALPARNKRGAAAGESESTGIIFGGEDGTGAAASSYSYNGTSWTAQSALNDDKRNLAGFGTENAAVATGWATYSTEIWDGTTWTNANVLLTKRDKLAGVGTQNSGITFGGRTNAADAASISTVTEVWNGYAWVTDSALLNVAIEEHAGAGGNQPSQAISFGGTNATTFTDATELHQQDGSGSFPPDNPRLWNTVDNMIQTRTDHAGAGTYNSAVVFGGISDTPFDNTSATTEEYNGTSWSSGGTMITGRRELMGVGLQNAALAFGGLTPTATTATEEYGGSSWSTGGSLPYTRYLGAGFGTQTAAVVAGGESSGATGILLQQESYEYNGSTWGGASTMNQHRVADIGYGTQNAGVAYSGISGSIVQYSFEEYNGTTWSDAGNSILPIREGAGAGTQNDAVVFGGRDISDDLNPYTAEWDGTAWSYSSGFLNVPRRRLAGSGTKTAAIATGGTDGSPAAVNFTEQYS